MVNLKENIKTNILPVLKYIGTPLFAAIGARCLVNWTWPHLSVEVSNFIALPGVVLFIVMFGLFFFDNMKLAASLKNEPRTWDHMLVILKMVFCGFAVVFFMGLLVFFLVSSL